MENDSGKERLERPWDMDKALRAKLNRFTADYMHLGRNEDAHATKRLLLHRDSILYRFEAIAYHFDLITMRERRCLDSFKSDLFRHDGIDVVRWASRDMKFLFDDIVFSTVSLFDYLANLVGFTLLNHARRNLKWGTLIGAFREVGRPESATAGTVVKAHNEWIKGLVLYRNSLIHVESDTAGGATQFTLDQRGASVEVRITAPQTFVKSVTGFQRRRTPRECSLTSAALWLAGQTFDSATDVLESLRRDIGLVSV